MVKKKLLRLIIPIMALSCLLMGCQGNSTSSTDDKVYEIDYENIDMSARPDSLTSEEYVLQCLLEKNDVGEASKKDIKSYVNDTIDYYTSYATSMGISYEDYVSNYLNQTTEEFETYLNSQASDYIKEKTILTSIAKADGIELTDEDYDAYLTSLLDSTYYNNIDDFKTNLENTNQSEIMHENALLNKVIDYVIDKNNP
jgi:trigger factor